MNYYNQIKNFDMTQMQNFLSELLNKNALPYHTICGNQLTCAGCKLVSKCVGDFLVKEIEER